MTAKLIVTMYATPLQNAGTEREYSDAHYVVTEAGALILRTDAELLEILAPGTWISCRREPSTSAHRP